jgi:hypothetical protein
MSKDDRTDEQKAAETQWEKAKKDIERHDREFDKKHGK